MMDLFFLSSDGKLLTQSELYHDAHFFRKLVQEQKNHELRLTPLSEQEVEQLQELSLVILPLLVGRQEALTLTGRRGDFLPILWQGELVTIEQHEGELFLHYVVATTIEKDNLNTE